MDKKFIPIPDKIGNRRKDENLGTTEEATNIDTEEPPGPSNGSGLWQRKGRRQRTEQLLSPQSRRNWGRTGISKAESKEEGTGGGSREPRMKRAGNQDDIK